jgi:hypothetical protein
LKDPYPFFSVGAAFPELPLPCCSSSDSSGM